MNTPYTYLVKYIPTGQVYYGVRYAKNCKPSDFFVKYFTSCKIIKDLIKECGIDNFVFEIRKTFKNASKAIDWERKVLRRCKVTQNTKFINMAYAPNSKILIEQGKYRFISNPNTLKVLMVPYDFDLPYGYIEGNIKNKIKKCYYDPITLENKKFSSTDIIPSNFILGRFENKKEKICITDGIHNKYIHPNEEIPENYYKGTTRSKKMIENHKKAHKKRLKVKWYNDGIKDFQFKKGEIPPDNLFKGRVSAKICPLIYITNGQIIKIISKQDEIENDFYEIKRIEKNKGPKKNSIVINNGLETKIVLSEHLIPFGWVRGRIKKF